MNVTSPPVISRNAVSFGGAASREEYKKIQNYASQYGVESDKIDPGLSHVHTVSRIPLWRSLQDKAVSIMIGIKLGIGLASKEDNDPQPYGAVLESYPSEKKARQALEKAQWKMEAQPPYAKNTLDIKTMTLVSPKELLIVLGKKED